MNRQLLKNVNPPLKQLLMFYCPERNAVFFAIRDEHGFVMANSYSDGLRESWRAYEFEAYKRMYGDRLYWTLFVKP